MLLYDENFQPLEGEELQQALEDLWENDPASFADAYIDLGHSEHIEFLTFADRLSALIWLRRTVNAGVVKTTKSHADSWRTGNHRVAGWSGESDDNLREEGRLLEDMSTISAGAVIAACAAALESLATSLLDRDSDLPLRKRGLQVKIAALIERWPHLLEPQMIRDSTQWIAERRNAFAHSLLDEAEPWNCSRGPWTFDDDAVEEAFTRVGDVASCLLVAWTADRRGAG